MDRHIAFPFLTLTESAVVSMPWTITVGDNDPIKAGTFVHHWDSSTEVRLERQVRVNRNAAARELEIDERELCVTLVCRVGTGQGRLPRLIVQRHEHPIEDPDSHIPLDLILAGSQLSAVIDLRTEIILSRRPVRTAGSLSPSRSGDKVWQDRHTIRLEGQDPRFPVQVVDLRKQLSEENMARAPWYLWWPRDDWERDFHGSLQLFLNSSRLGFLRRIKEEDPHTLQLLMADVMGQVCGRLVMERDADERIPDWAAGTLGRQAAEWLKMGWPGKTIKHVRGVFENERGRFGAVMLSIAELSAE